MAQSSLSRLPLAARLGLSVGVLVLVAIAYFVVFYGDLASSITAARGQERQLRSDLADAQREESAYQKDLSELADRRARKAEYNKILPADTEYPQFLSSLQSVANVTGISLAAWTPLSEIPEQFYSRVPMQLEVQGRYHQIAKFFYGVSQIDRVINMEGIKLTSPKPEEEGVVIKAEVLATAFRSVEPTETDKRGTGIQNAPGANQPAPAPPPQPTPGRGQP